MVKDRSSRRRWLKACACVLLLASLTFLVAIPFGRTVEFNFGAKTVSLRLESLVVNGPFSNEGVFVRTAWDGSTGSFSSGQMLGLKLGSHLLRLGIVHDPITAAQRRLPTTLSGLIKAIASNDRWLRFCALKELAGMGAAAQPALPALIAATERGDFEAENTLQIVSKAAGADAVPVLTNALSSRSAAMCVKVAEILGEMGTVARPAIPGLASCLKDTEPRLKLRSAYSLWKVGGGTHDSVPVLLALLSNQDSEIRGGAAAVLGEFGDQASEAVPALITTLGDSNAQVRAMSARALGMIGPAGQPAIPRLIAQLDEKDHTVLMWTTIALRQFGEHARDAIPGLTELAMKEDSSARWSIEALATMGTNAAPALARIFRDAKRGNRHFAAKSLIELGSKAAAALPVVMEQLNGDHAGDVSVAAQVVGHLGDGARVAAPRLIELLDTDYPRLRVRAAGALWRLNRQTNVVMPALMSMLRDDSIAGSAVRRLAAEELAEMGPAAIEATPLLEAMLHDQQTGLHKVAVKALDAIAPNGARSEAREAKSGIDQSR